MTNEFLGKDIALNPEYDITFNNNQDFNTVSDEKNLRQAVINRLLTFKGEMYNEEYGSELYKALGDQRDSILLNRIRGFIIETLRQEPRIRDIKEVIVAYNEQDRQQIDVTVNVLSINAQIELNLVFPLFL